MADLLWFLVVPVLLLAITFWMLRAIFGTVRSVTPGARGGGSGGLGVVWIVSTLIRAAGSVVATILSGVVFPLLRSLGRTSGAGWRAGVQAAARRSVAAPNRPPRPTGDLGRPSPFERRFWFTTAAERDFDAWEQEHYEPREDHR